MITQEREQTKDQTQASGSPKAPRQAFSVHLTEQGIRRTLSNGLEPSVAKEIAIDTIAKNWSGFSWEYGLKEPLRFTPYLHNYYQVLDNVDHLFKAVCEEDLLTGISFESRLDPTERNGLVAEATRGMMDKFISSPVGTRFLAASPLGEDFSDYSFLYFCSVVETQEGKKLEVQDFLNDLDQDQFIDLFNQVTKTQTLSKNATTEQVMNTFVEVDFEDSKQVWEAMIKAKPNQAIFDTPIEQILALNNVDLLKRTKTRSRIEAERLFDEIISGVDLDLLQSQIGPRLRNCVESLLGSSFNSEVFEKSIDGSCGIVEMSNNKSMPNWCEFNPISGEFRCKLCQKEFSRVKIHQHRCKCK